MSGGNLMLADGRPPCAASGGLLNPAPEWEDRVVEMAWSAEPRGWVALHARPDKPQRGNARDTFDDTWQKIGEAVTLADIEDVL